MIEPTVDDMLRAAREEIETQVLPKLEGEGERRQLKAALAILKRVEAVWDKVYPTLDANNFDLDTTLRLLLPSLESVGADPPRMREILDEPGDYQREQTFAGMRARHLALERLVVEVQELMVGVPNCPERFVIDTELRGLHGRMAARERALSGRRVETTAG